MQRNRRRGDNDRFVCFNRLHNSGHQVGQRLTRTRARLDGQVSIAREGFSHSASHFHLIGARSATETRYRFAEQFLDGVGVVDAVVRSPHRRVGCSRRFVGIRAVRLIRGVRHSPPAA